MDLFGIGQAVKAVANVYFQSSRRSGRTVSMIESVKDGDRICFASSEEAERVGRLCKERGVDVECIVIPPSEPERIFERGTSIGRTIFDHSWIEERYINAVEACERGIDHFERQSSGWGEAHRETERKAIELSKWRT